MNWVGGARNRVKFQGDRRQQKVFFERKKLDIKCGSMKKPAVCHTRKKKKKISQDLVALQTVSDVSNKASGSVRSVNVQQIDFDHWRSRGKAGRRENVVISVGNRSCSYRRPERVELPYSPELFPSRLQLLESHISSSTASKSSLDGIQMQEGNINMPAMHQEREKRIWSNKLDNGPLSTSRPTLTMDLNWEKWQRQSFPFHEGWSTSSSLVHNPFPQKSALISSEVRETNMDKQFTHPSTCSTMPNWDIGSQKPWTLDEFKPAQNMRTAERCNYNSLFPTSRDILKTNQCTREKLELTKSATCTQMSEQQTAAHLCKPRNFWLHERRDNEEFAGQSSSDQLSSVVVASVSLPFIGKDWETNQEERSQAAFPGQFSSLDCSQASLRTKRMAQTEDCQRCSEIKYRESVGKPRFPHALSKHTDESPGAEENQVVYRKDYQALTAQPYCSESRIRHRELKELLLPEDFQTSPHASSHRAEESEPYVGLSSLSPSFHKSKTACQETFLERPGRSTPYSPSPTTRATLHHPLHSCSPNLWKRDWHKSSNINSFSASGVLDKKMSSPFLPKSQFSNSCPGSNSVDLKNQNNEVNNSSLSCDSRLLLLQPFNATQLVLSQHARAVSVNSLPDSDYRHSEQELKENDKKTLHQYSPLYLGMHVKKKNVDTSCGTAEYQSSSAEPVASFRSKKQSEAEEVLLELEQLETLSNSKDLISKVNEMNEKGTEHSSLLSTSSCQNNHRQSSKNNEQETRLECNNADPDADICAVDAVDVARQDYPDSSVQDVVEALVHSVVMLQNGKSWTPLPSALSDRKAKSFSWKSTSDSIKFRKLYSRTTQTICNQADHNMDKIQKLSKSVFVQTNWSHLQADESRDCFNKKEIVDLGIQCELPPPASQRYSSLVTPSSQMFVEKCILSSAFKHPTYPLIPALHQSTITFIVPESRQPIITSTTLSRYPVASVIQSRQQSMAMLTASSSQEPYQEASIIQTPKHTVASTPAESSYLQVYRAVQTPQHFIATPTTEISSQDHNLEASVVQTPKQSKATPIETSSQHLYLTASDVYTPQQPRQYLPRPRSSQQLSPGVFSCSNATAGQSNIYKSLLHHNCN